MRFLLLAFLSVLVSCGEQSSNKSSQTQERQDEEYVTNIQGVDLLDVAMDVPVEISGGQILFKQSVADSAAGVRSSCTVGVTSGEAYSYALNGSSLLVKTSNGQSMNFARVSGEAGSILGSWTSKSVQSGQLIMRRLTFVSENRMIMRTHCEG